MDTPMWWAAEEPNPVLPHTAEIIVGLVAFLLLLFILRKFVVPRFEQVYQERVDKIEGGLQRAEEAQAKANQTLKEYQAKLAEVRVEAAKIRDDARADAESIRQEVLAQAREEADRIIAAGRDALAAERATLVRELRAEFGALSVELASRIIGESLADEARRSGTVERFLAELESSNGRPATDPDAAPAGAR